MLHNNLENLMGEQNDQQRSISEESWKFRPAESVEK